MGNINFTYTIMKSWENGERLYNDAQELFDHERYPTVFALSIIAQEEFSKAFLFHLVAKNIISWHPFIKRAIHDHSSKQLVGLVLDHLNPETDNFLKYIKRDKNYDDSYKKAIDAINLLKYEKFERWEDPNIIYDYDFEFHNESKKTLKGKLDKEKQDSLYVRVNKNSEVVFDPLKINKENAEKMFERAERFLKLIKYFIEDKEYEPFDYEQIENAFKILFKKYSGI